MESFGYNKNNYFVQINKSIKSLLFDFRPNMSGKVPGHSDME